MPLINCKIHLELKWAINCVMSNTAGDTTFKIRHTKLYVFIITLSTKDKVKLTNKLNEGFERYVYQHNYKTKIESKEVDENLTRFYLDASFERFKRLFVLAFDNTDNCNEEIERNGPRKYFFPRVNVTNYNVLIDGRNFCNQPINDQIKKFDEIRKVATGQENDDTTG